MNHNVVIKTRQKKKLNFWKHKKKKTISFSEQTYNLLNFSIMIRIPLINVSINPAFLFFFFFFSCLRLFQKRFFLKTTCCNCKCLEFEKRFDLLLFFSSNDFFLLMLKSKVWIFDILFLTYPLASAVILLSFHRSIQRTDCILYKKY